MRKVFTIGYEAAALPDFISTLRDAGVDLLVDVRELPMSRRRGYSKTALSEALRAVGIQYLHRRELGSPRDARHELRATGDLVTFFGRFDKHLEANRDALKSVAEAGRGKRVALMCFERNHETCHRLPVAAELGKMVNRRPQHLEVCHGRTPHTESANPC